jgi:16S rRNA (cytosine1402-N4)-methyltransferase
MQVRPDGIYVDGTFGRGGHAAAVLQRLGADGRLIVMDRDPEAIASARQQHGEDSRVSIVHADYTEMKSWIEEQGLGQAIDGILLDLGVSSPQLDDASRGFSFQQNGPLDMRMNTSTGETAQAWLMQAPEQEIADVLWRYGEERYSRRIARRIVEYREEQDITDTQTLVEIIRDCIPSPRGKKRQPTKHPATRSFQAIRIRINRELEQLETLLADLFDILRIGGRLLIISFHSLEDRLVKRFMREQSTPPKLPRGLPLKQEELSLSVRLKLIGKAIKAGSEETAQNPRARSAVLRVAERVS